ncbi:hypothetical protein H0H87_012298, partial [Tephrocybe sp. NHM501043]
MNTANAYTGHSPFQLKSGFSAHCLPAISTSPLHTVLDSKDAAALFQKYEIDFLDAMDNLTAAKLIQAYHANASQNP